MLNSQEAQHYAEQLHPAFAGYLFDGTVSEKDALATVFHLIKKGFLEPEFRDHDITLGLEAVRVKARKPEFAFEQLIVKDLFQGRQRLTTKEIGVAIKSGHIQKLIEENVNSIQTFPIINQRLKFLLGNNGVMSVSINGEEIDTPEEYHQLHKKSKWLVIGMGGFFGVFFIALLFIFLLERFLVGMTSNIQLTSEQATVMTGFNQQSNRVSGFMLLVLTTIGLVFGSFGLAFKRSQKKVTYQFKEEIVPLAKEKYAQLYQFLQAFPPRPHTFTYEYIPYAIAFDLDTSWHADFGLSPEGKITDSPINESPAV